MCPPRGHVWPPVCNVMFESPYRLEMGKEMEVACVSLVKWGAGKVKPRCLCLWGTVVRTGLATGDRWQAFSRWRCPSTLVASLWPGSSCSVRVATLPHTPIPLKATVSWWPLLSPVPSGMQMRSFSFQPGQMTWTVEICVAKSQW